MAEIFYYTNRGAPAHSPFQAVGEELAAYEARLRSLIDSEELEGVQVRVGDAIAAAVLGELVDSEECVAELGRRLDAVISAGESPELEELRACVGGGRGIEGHKNVWVHTLRVVARTPDDLIARLGALYHDIGKPATRGYEPGRGVHFDGHEHVGADIFARQAARYGWPDQLVDGVEAIIRGHLRAHQADTMTDAGVRRYVRDAGIGGWERLGAVTRADCTSKHAHKRADAERRVDELEENIRRVAHQDARRRVRGPIGGREIGERYGLSQGKELGALVKAVVAAAQERWEEGDELTEAEAWGIVEDARRAAA